MQRFEYYRDLVLVLTQKEIKARYRNYLLGYFWSILHPLAFALCFFIAFKIIMRFEIEDYALFLICGLFPWQWFSNSLTASTAVFLRDASLIKKLSFPKTVLPLSVVLQDMINFLLSLPVVAVFVLMHDRAPSVAWLYGIPLLVVIQLFLVYGFALAAATVNVFFRDLERLVVILTTLLFYLTPIIYPLSMIPEQYRALLLAINPVAAMMLAWRQLLLHGSLDWGLAMIGVAHCTLICLLGYLVYRRLCWKFAEVI